MCNRHAALSTLQQHGPSYIRGRRSSLLRARIRTPTNRRITKQKRQIRKYRYERRKTRRTAANRQTSHTNLACSQAGTVTQKRGGWSERADKAETSSVVNPKPNVVFSVVFGDRNLATYLYGNPGNRPTPKETFDKNRKNRPKHFQFRLTTLYTG